jgi:hypothetical protein
MPVVWSELPLLEQGATRSEGHHEPERGRLDANTIPLGPIELAGGCGHHEERTHVGAVRFWGWRHVPASDTWERANGGLDINPGEILAEMRARAA